MALVTVDDLWKIWNTSKRVDELFPRWIEDFSLEPTISENFDDEDLLTAILKWAWQTSLIPNAHPFIVQCDLHWKAEKNIISIICERGEMFISSWQKLFKILPRNETDGTGCIAALHVHIFHPN